MLSERAQLIMHHVSKSETIDIDTALNIGGYYYHNSRKHIGEVLSTLVRNGYIERIKPGLFKFKTMSPHSRHDKRDIINKNAPKLF